MEAHSAYRSQESKPPFLPKAKSANSSLSHTMSQHTTASREFMLNVAPSAFIKAQEREPSDEVIGQCQVCCMLDISGKRYDQEVVFSTRLNRRAKI
jgi:hypothetical protein